MIYEGFVQTTLEISVESGPPLAFFSRIYGTEGNFGFPISLHKWISQILAAKPPSRGQLSLVRNKLPPAHGAMDHVV